MRELAVQSANDSNTASDRSSLQKEIVQNQQELDRIATTTEFNGKKLLDGTFSSQIFQVGASKGQTISFSIGNTRSTNIGDYALNINGTLNQATAAAGTFAASTSPVLGTEDLTITGAQGTSLLNVAAAATAKTIAGQVNAVTSNTGVQANAVTNAKLDGMVGTGNISFDLFGSNTTAVNFSVQVNSTSDLSGIATAINNKASSTGITASLDANGAVLLTNKDGYDVGVQNWSGSTINVTGLDNNLATQGGAVTLGAAATTDSTRVGGTISFTSSNSYTVTSGAAGGLFTATTANSGALSAVGSIDIGTQSGAANALAAIDGAISFIDQQRADLGAVQNRFQSTIANLQNISENISSARSRILDADVAQETSNMTKQNILQQAGVAILAQANQTPQLALSLLK
jgi:flagellin